MKNVLFGVVFACGLQISSAQAVSVVAAKVEEFNDRTELLLQFDEPLVQQPGLFRVANPTRQVIDFPLVLDNANLPVSFGAESRIKNSQMITVGSKTRLVLQLFQNYEVSAQPSGADFKLVVSGPRPFIADRVQTTALAQDSGLKTDVKEQLGKAPPVGKGPMLEQVSFEQVGVNELIRLKFSGTDLLSDAVLNNDALRIRFAHSQVAEVLPKLHRGQSGKLFDGFQLKPGDQTLFVQLQLKQALHEIRQVGDVVEVLLSPLGQARAAASNPTVAVKPLDASQSLVARYAGKPISLDFKDVEIRTVMQVFAEFTKMNLVLSDSVQGKVTVHLKDVPWDQALDIVMRSKGLVASQSGNVLLVSTPADVANDQFQVANSRAQDEMEPVVSRVFQISYQKTADLVALLKAEDSKLLSARGTLISDERTGQIFIQDTPTRLERITSVINGLDKPVKQVMIEARVVLADRTVSKDLGVNIRSASAVGVTPFTEVSEQFGSKGFADTGAGATANLAYTLFNANSTRLINVQLRALEQADKIRTVSNPRVITSNKETALIEQGTEIPYQIATSSGATAIEFKEANLKLEVTPQIAPDGTVLLNVDVAKDSVGITTAAGPAIDTRRVKTKVLVADGGTVVLGGIFEEDDNVTDQKTPLLGDIPVVGYLFKSKQDRKRRAELLIFLTPVVLADS